VHSSTSGGPERDVCDKADAVAGEDVEAHSRARVSPDEQPQELDFGALLQVETIEDQAGVPQSVVPVLLTSRVKIPPTVVFEVLRALK
jgi:hypothetical protein